MKSKIFTGVLFIVLILGVVFLLTPKNTVAPEETPKAEQDTVDQTENNANNKKMAGKTSYYSSFSQPAYEKALGDGKIIFLDFYATWCPICRAEAPDILSGFNSLNTDKVVGFRVNFNDEETDDDEKALAKKFSVPYQHTKIILKDGKEVLRSGDQWDKETFLDEINKVTE